MSASEEVASSEGPGLLVVSTGPRSATPSTSNNKEKGTEKRVRDRIVESCLPCYQRKRKCDKEKPICGRCAESSNPSKCHWDPKLVSIRTKTKRIRRGKTFKEMFKSKKSEHELLVELAFSASLLPGSANCSTGNNRLWFDVVVQKYGEMCPVYTKPTLSAKDLHQLYDMWRDYLRTDDVTLRFKTDSREDRMLLYHGLHCIAAFAAACAHLDRNMAFHAKHLAAIAVEIAKKAVDTVRIFRDSSVTQMALSLYLLWRCGNDSNLIGHDTRDGICALFKDLDGIMDSETSLVCPDFLVVNYVAKVVGRGEWSTAAAANLSMRKMDLMDPSIIFNPGRLRGLATSSMLVTPCLLMLSGARWEHSVQFLYNMDDPRIEFSNVPVGLQQMWIQQSNDLFCIGNLCRQSRMCTPIQSPEIEESFDFLLAALNVQTGFCMSWVGGLGPYPISLIEAGMKILMRSGNPFNSPYALTLVFGARILVLGAPAIFMGIWNGIGEIEIDKLSGRGAECYKYFKNSADLIMSQRSIVPPGATNALVRKVP